MTFLRPVIIRPGLLITPTPTLISPLVRPGQRVQHIKGTTYTVVASGMDEKTWSPNVLYQSDESGIIVARKSTQFLDGRFTPLEEHDMSTQYREAIIGLLMEWDKLTKYGSPIAKAANERVSAARKLVGG